MSTIERENLQAAIDAHRQAIEDVEAVGETLHRAQEYLAGLNRTVSSYHDLDAQIAASRADAIERAILAGETPTLDPSPELAAAAAAKVDAENQFSGAKAAVASIERKIADLKEKVARLDLEKEWAAEKVLAAEAHESAIAFNAKLSELRREFYRFHAIRNQFVRVDPKTKPAPLYPGQIVSPTRPVDLSQDVKDAAAEVGVLGRYEELSGLALGNKIANGVGDFFKRLRDDASAMFEDSML